MSLIRLVTICAVVVLASAERKERGQEKEGRGARSARAGRSLSEIESSLLDTMFRVPAFNPSDLFGPDHKVKPAFIPNVNTFKDLSSSLLNYLVVHDAYYDWTKGWLPDGADLLPSSQKWFAMGGQPLYEKFLDNCEELVKYWAPAFFPLKRMFESACVCEVEEQPNLEKECDTVSIPGGGNGLVMDVSGGKICDGLKYTKFSQNDVEVVKGEEGSRQFDFIFDVTTIAKSDFVTNEKVYTTDQGSFTVQLGGELAYSGLPSGFQLSIEAPSKLRGSPKVCVMDANFNEVGVSVLECKATKLTFELTVGGERVSYDCVEGSNTLQGLNRKCPDVPAQSDQWCFDLCQAVQTCACGAVKEAVAPMGNDLGTLMSDTYKAALPVCHDDGLNQQRE